MKYLLYIALVSFMVSCTNPEVPEASLVVEAYLYENKPVENIKLSLVNPINSESTEEAVSSAMVSIQWNGIIYPLEEKNDTGYYSAIDSSLQIISGHTYELLIEYNEVELRAETTVPVLPTSLSTSKDTLNLSSSSDFINVNWENIDSLWHLGVIQPNDPNLTEFPFNNFFSVPTQGNELEIKPIDVQNTGINQFILYAITEDYENFYRISSSSIGSSNAGNLSNGFGIFTAFSSDTVNIIAIKK